MDIKKQLYLGVAAIGVAGFLAAAPAQLRAQTAVAIDNDDIGGVVTGPNGPEAGVWVIAETTRPADPLRQDRRHRRSGPLRRPRSAEGEIQRLGARLRPGRFAEGRRRARQAAQPDRRARRRTTRRPRKYYPAIYWYSMLKIPPRQRVRRQGRHPRQDQEDRLAQPDEEQRLRRLPSARPARDAHDPEVPFGRSSRRAKPGCGASSPARPARSWSASSPASSAACRSSISPTGPTASPRASCRTRKPTASGGRRAQCRRDDLGLGERQAVPARPDLDRPAQPDGQRLRPALRLAANMRPTTCRSSIPVKNTATNFHAAGARPDMPLSARPGPRGVAQAARTLGLLGRGEDLGHQAPTTTTR